MIEMDKSRDVRRGASRFYHQIQLFSGLSTVSGGSGGSISLEEKSKKERIRKLSAVNRASSSSCHRNCEMGCDTSDREEQEVELPSQTPPVGTARTGKKRFKLPRKEDTLSVREQFYDDCNGVDHVSVPRKLRSAMRKRSGKSVSTPFQDSKKVIYITDGVEAPKKEGLKKLKRDVRGPDCSPDSDMYGPITKDEEEVVETLYALAGMFSDNAPNIKIKLECSENPIALPETIKSQPAREGPVAIKEDLNSICLAKTEEDVHFASNIEGSPEETLLVSSLIEQVLQEPSILCSSKKIQGEPDNSDAQLNLHTTLSKRDEQKPSCSSVKFCVAPDLYRDTGTLKWPVKLETSPLNSKPEILINLIASTGSQLEQLDTIDESNKNGLSSVMSTGAWSQKPLARSSAVKVPTWLDAAVTVTKPDAVQNVDAAVTVTKPDAVQNVLSIGKAPKFYADKRSWKRCVAHVYISRLIWALQSPDNKDSLLVQQTNQQRLNEVLKQGVRNVLNGVTSASGTVNSYEKISNEARTDNNQHQNQPLAGFASGAYTSSKESFNFLSLSTGGGALEAKSSSNGAGIRLGWMAQIQAPYRHPNVQHPTIMPFSISQTRYNSSAFPDQPSASAGQQAHLQLPPYLGTPLYDPRTSQTPLMKQQQQQRRLWAAQLAAQYRITGISTAVTEFPSWQNGRQDPAAVIPCAQAIIPPSPSSLEVFCPKYPHISQRQQQQLMTISTSLPPVRVKKQDRHFSLVHDETGGGFRTGGALPLQLLCNDRQ